MDDFIGKFVKILSSTVVVRIMSCPCFAIEIFLASVVCVVHCLLIFEINTLVRRTNAKAAARLRMRHPLKDTETCSFHSLVTLQTTQVFQKKPEVFNRTSMYGPIQSSRLQKGYSRPNFRWMLSKGDSILKHKFSDRVEHLLSISPSEYVRRDKERKSREQGLRSCIQSLTSLLEKALNKDALDIQNMSKEHIQKSINTLRENFETQLINTNLNDFPSPSLQSLIDQNNTRRTFKNSLSPELLTSLYQTSNVSFSRSSYDTRAKKRKEEEEKSDHSKGSLSQKSSESLSELFRKQSNDFFNIDQSRNTREILAS